MCLHLPNSERVSYRYGMLTDAPHKLAVMLSIRQIRKRSGVKTDRYNLNLNYNGGLQATDMHFCTSTG